MVNLKRPKLKVKSKGIKARQTWDGIPASHLLSAWPATSCLTRLCSVLLREMQPPTAPWVGVRSVVHYVRREVCGAQRVPSGKPSLQVLIFISVGSRCLHPLSVNYLPPVHSLIVSVYCRMGQIACSLQSGEWCSPSGLIIQLLHKHLSCWLAELLLYVVHKIKQWTPDVPILEEFVV